MLNEQNSIAQPTIETQLSTVNTIEIVGGLVPMRGTRRQQDREQPVTVQHTTMYRAQCTRVLVQVEEEDGAVYALPIDVSISLLEWQAVDAPLQPGDRVRIQGRLRTEATFDRRFATADNPDGRPTSMVTIAVAHLCRADPDDVDGSWLRLTGRISVPATIRRHERAPAEEVGRTSLVVQWIEPSHRPGSQARHVRIDRIPLDIPLLIDGSTNGLRTGNLVLIEGRLEPFFRPLRPTSSQFVQRHLEELQTRWQSEAAVLSATERAQRERQHVRQLRSLGYEQRLRVRAGYVALLEGQSSTIEEARAAHEAFVAQQKQRRRTTRTT